jgi:hypothetical protein
MVALRNDLVERVTLRRINPTFGIADVRLAAVHLRGMRVRERSDGSLEITAPVETGRDGRTWPTYYLQPGARESVEAEIAAIWARSA